MRTRQIEILAKHLARFYAEYAPDWRVCACVGLDGVCIECTQWWVLFLHEMTKEKWDKMWRLYSLAGDGRGY